MLKVKRRPGVRVGEMLNYRQESIAAGASFNVSSGGTFFLLRRATLPVKVAFDGGQANDWEAGISFEPPGGFSSITIQNQDANQSCNVGFYIGTGAVRFAAPNIRLPDTYFFGAVNSSVAPAGTVTFQPRSSKIGRAHV